MSTSENTKPKNSFKATQEDILLRVKLITFFEKIEKMKVGL